MTTTTRFWEITATGEPVLEKIKHDGDDISGISNPIGVDPTETSLVAYLAQSTSGYTDLVNQAGYDASVSAWQTVIDNEIATFDTTDDATAAAENPRKNNYTATTDPGLSNDDSEGYEPGSEWLNTVSGSIFKCVDAATGAADWNDITAVGGGGGGTTIAVQATAPGSPSTDDLWIDTSKEISKTLDGSWIVYNYGEWKEYIREFTGLAGGSTGSLSAVVLSTGETMPTGVAPTDVIFEVAADRSSSPEQFYVSIAINRASSLTTETFDIRARNITSATLSPANINVTVRLIER